MLKAINKGNLFIKGLCTDDKKDLVWLLVDDRTGQFFEFSEAGKCWLVYVHWGPGTTLYSVSHDDIIKLFKGKIHVTYIRDNKHAIVFADGAYKNESFRRAVGHCSILNIRNECINPENRGIGLPGRWI